MIRKSKPDELMIRKIKPDDDHDAALRTRLSMILQVMKALDYNEAQQVEVCTNVLINLLTQRIMRGDNDVDEIDSQCEYLASAMKNAVLYNITKLPTAGSA